MSVRIKCSRCDGTGCVEINGVFSDTLDLLRQQAAETTGAKLATIVGCAGTAMNNRLAWLEKMGFAKSRRYGKERLYVAFTKGAKP